MRAHGSQIGGPGQTKNFNAEFWIHLGEIGLHNFGDNLAGGVAGVVEHLEAEANFPDVIGVFASGNAVFVDVSQLEFLSSLFQVVVVERSFWIVAGHARQRQNLGLNSFALVDFVDDYIPVERIREGFADVNVIKEGGGHAQQQ